MFVKNLETGQMFLDSYGEAAGGNRSQGHCSDLEGTDLSECMFYKQWRMDSFLKTVNRPDIMNIVIAGGGYHWN